MVSMYSILRYTASTATYKSKSKQLTATATGKMGKTVQKHEVDWLFMEKSIMMPSNTAGQDVGVLISLMFKSCHYSHFRSCPSSTASKSPNSMSGFSSLTSCHTTTKMSGKSKVQHVKVCPYGWMHIEYRITVDLNFVFQHLEVARCCKMLQG